MREWVEQIALPKYIYKGEMNMKKEILIDIDTNDVNQPIIISMENATGMHYPIEDNDIRASVVKAVKNYLSNIKIED